MIKQKLKSRKLWASVIGVAVGLFVALGGDGGTVQSIAGSVMSVVSALVYVLAEASVDRASAAAPVQTVVEDKP